MFLFISHRGSFNPGVISYLGGAWWSALAENTVKQTRASNLLL